MGNSIYGRIKSDQEAEKINSLIEKGLATKAIVEQTGATRTRVTTLKIEYKYRDKQIRDIDIFMNAEWWGDLNRRISRLLARSGCTTKSDILQLLKTGEIRNIRNLGDKSVDALYQHFLEG